MCKRKEEDIEEPIKPDTSGIKELMHRDEFKIGEPLNKYFPVLWDAYTTILRPYYVEKSLYDKQEKYKLEKKREKELKLNEKVNKIKEFNSRGVFRFEDIYMNESSKCGIKNILKREAKHGVFKLYNDEDGEECVEYIKEA